MSGTEKLVLMQIQIKALERLGSDFEGLLAKARIKREKEVTKEVAKAKVLSEYASEDEIADAYGWGYITEKQRCELMEAFEKQREYKDIATSRPTVLTEYIRMLRRDIREIQQEIIDLRQDIKRGE
jgi:hypothetical protein